MTSPLLGAGMLFYRSRYWRPLERMTHRPAVAQRDVLRSLLSANRDTRFGSEHGFADISDHAGFARR
jgi:hypothetical protein